MADERADRGGGPPPLTEAPPSNYQRELTIGDPAWGTFLPCINDVLEVCLLGSSVETGEEAWRALLVTSASRPATEVAVAVVEGTYLNAKAHSKPRKWQPSSGMARFTYAVPTLAPRYLLGACYMLPSAACGAWSSSNALMLQGKEKLR